MEFKLNANEVKTNAPIIAPISFTVTEKMRIELQEIKSSSKQNRRIVCHLTRQFLSQLIEKFKEGAFDTSAPIEENDMRKLLGC